MFRATTSRRRFLRGALGACGVLGLGRTAFSWMDRKPNGRAKRCVVLWMDGGPSQLETFDPKPGATTGGPTKAIATNVSGLRIAENLPQIAKRMNHLAVLRNVTSPEGEHARAQYFLHTGFRLVPAFPRPALGSVMSHETPEMDFPKYILLGGQGYGPAYCGPDHASFVIENAQAARQLLGRIQTRRDELEFLRILGAEFNQRNNFSSVARRESMLSRIERLVATPFRDALNLEAESNATRTRYGDSEFGRRCLLARRLLQRDVPFVEVQLGGWDTHVNNFNQVARLTGQLDAAWSALVDDLVAEGLWDDTLLIWMGEFGRTPNINGQNGRDHFPAVTPVVLGGGCLRTGQAIGETSRSGARIVGDNYRVADVSATILHLLGVDLSKDFQTSFGSPTKPTDNGKVIAEV